MARRNGAGYGYPWPYNETDPGGGIAEPDTKGVLGIYMGGWPEIDRFHLLQTGPMDETPNSMSGRDDNGVTGIMGGVAPGEPDPRKDRIG